MFRFFDSFSKGCGCVLGVVAGIVVVLIIVALVFGACEVQIGI